MLTFRNAVKKIEKDEKVKDLHKKGYFLNSGISILAPDEKEIGNWILIYYHVEHNEVVQVLVNGDIELKKPAEPMGPTLEELKLSDIKTNVSKMFLKAQTEFKKQKKPLSQIIVTIQHEKEKILWKFNFITKSLEIVMVHIDAKNGEIISVETTPLTTVTTD